MKRKLNCVLLIDDDEPTNFLNRMVVEEAGCANNILVMQNAEDALQYLHRVHNNPQDGTLYFPELIFLDINMPAMDGWEFLEKYQELPATGQHVSVVVMLTTSFNPEDELRAREISCISDYLNKPLTHDALAGILTAHFARN